MHLEAHEVHIWKAELTSALDWLKQQPLALSQDEIARADRYRFEKHKNRFMAARGILRYLLGRYLSLDVRQIYFSYQEHRKPKLDPHHESSLAFNLSHSENKAIFGFTLKYDIGVDIEKIQSTFKKEVAKRFFSPEEYQQFIQLSDDDQVKAFYGIWARKEALIKATGKGLAIPLSSFTVPVREVEKQIFLENKTWTLLPLPIDAQFQAALATDQIIKKIQFYNFLDYFAENAKL